jgi:hypothetical protein
MPNGVSPGEPSSPPPPPPPPPGAQPGPAAGGFQLPPIDPQALSKTPWVVGAAAILVSLVVYWFGSIISALAAGLSFRERISGGLFAGEGFLGPANYIWALAVLLAVALLVLGSSSEDKRSAVVGLLNQLLLLASGLIAAAAAVNAIVWLTDLGSSPDAALASFVQYLAAVPIAGAAALWAWRSSSSSSAGPRR